MTKAVRLISLLLPVGILLSFSLTMLGGIDNQYLEQQMISIIVASVFFLILYVVDYHIFTLSPMITYWLVNISLVITFIFGSFARGSVRWIDLGFIRFQTSEIIKPLMIVFFALLISKIGDSSKKYVHTIMLALVPVGLVFLQPDLGSALMIGVVIASQAIASNMSKKFLIFTLLAVLLASPILWGVLRPYQKDRIYSFLGPDNDPLGKGYNAIQAVISVGSGSLTGRGLGQGTQSQLRFLPERQTDFIFASISEEFGFLGSATIVLSYAWLLYVISVFASSAKDEVGKLICVGAFFMIFTQAFVNIGMNVGLLPITGITLPFVSLGGSSLIAIGMVLGIVANTQQAHIKNAPAMEIK